MRFMLKPCPFCGNEKPNLLEIGGDWYVECGEKRNGGCTAQMIMVGSQAQAVLNWNTRETYETAMTHEHGPDLKPRTLTLLTESKWT